MNVVKNGFHYQSSIDKSKNLRLFPLELVQSMIHEDKKYSVEDARKILNSRFKGEFKDIIHEIRNE